MIFSKINKKIAQKRIFLQFFSLNLFFWQKN